MNRESVQFMADCIERARSMSSKEENLTIDYVADVFARMLDDEIPFFDMERFKKECDCAN